MKTALALIGALAILTACGNNGPAQVQGQNGQQGWTQAYQQQFTTQCIQNATQMNQNNGGMGTSSQISAYCSCALNAVMPMFTPTNIPSTDTNSQQLQNIEQQCNNSSGLANSGNYGNYYSY